MISGTVRPKKASDFRHLPEFDYYTSDGHFSARFSLAGSVVLLTLEGKADREEDLVLFDRITWLVETHFSDNTPFYMVVDISSMQQLGLDVRRGLINRTMGGLKAQRTIIFGGSQAARTMVNLGKKISPAFKQYEMVDTLQDALKLLGKKHADPPKGKPITSQLNEREQELLTTLSDMIWNSDYNRQIPDLEPGDPFGDLFHAVSSLQKDFQQLVDANARSRRALTDANLQLSQRVKEKTQQLTQTEENYQLVVESASDGIAILDDGIVRYANPQMLALLGYSWEEVFGQPLEKFASAGARKAIEDMVSRRRHAGENVHTQRDTSLINKQGEQLSVEIHATLMPYEGQSTVLAFVHDISNRKRMEQAEKHARQLAETLRETGTILGATLDRNQILGRMLQLVKQVVPYDVCEIFVVDEPTSRMNLLLNTDESQNEYSVLVAAKDSRMSEWPTYRKIIETQQPLIIPDTSAYPDWVIFNDDTNIISWMGVPVLIRDRVAAIISLYKHEIDFYTQEHFKNVQLFANQVNLALENAWLYEEANKRITELSILNEIGEAIARIDNLPELFDGIYNKVSTIFKVNNFAVVTYHEETDEFSILYWINDGIPQPYERRKVDFPPVAQVIATQRPLLIPDEVTFSTLLSAMNSHYNGLPLESWMGVPLLTSGKVVGVIAVLTREPGRSFTAEEFSLFNIIGSQVSASVEKERLRKEAENEAVIQERQRLARDLHDSISQLLYSQVLYADAAQKYLTTGRTTQSLDYMRQMTETARQALREMRLMIYELRPQALQEHGLEQAINNRLEQVERRTGINARFNCLVPDGLPLAVETELYYIIIEALNNALKHARAENIHINLYRENGEVALVVSDDGRGFDPGSGKAGIGLKTMRERAEKLGGTLEIQSDVESGSSINIKFKLEEATK